MARERKERPVATVPQVNVWNNYAFYLHPQGCTGVAAIAYLPGYAASVRQVHERLGFKLLSRVRGELNQTGEERLIISFPDDETIQWVVDELHRRVEAERERIQDDIDQRTEKLEGGEVEGRERTLYRQAIAQLGRARDSLEQGIPTFTRLKRYFVKEHTLRLSQNIPAAQRQALEGIAVEAQYQRLTQELIEQEAQETATATKRAARKEPEPATA